MADLTKQYGALVVGGGNGALCAAIAARREGASVLLLEGAPKFYRGGNTRYTRNIRCAHDSATETLTGPYSEEELFDDLLRVTGGKTDVPLAKHMIRESKEVLVWLTEQGVRYQPSLDGTRRWDGLMRSFSAAVGPCLMHFTARRKSLASTFCTMRRLQPLRSTTACSCRRPQRSLGERIKCGRAHLWLQQAGLNLTSIG